ncbi:MAG TPA: hypothetical protein ENK18_25365, partial [Deltaproteobacteria bacterium]|nr:hypothetical protein [Deltaproteobacteria bacterium]
HEPPAPDSPERLAYIGRLLVGPLIGTFLAVPALALLVWSNRLFTLIPSSILEPLAQSDSALARLAGTLAAEISTPTGLILAITGVLALAYILLEANRSSRVERERLFVAVTLMFFSMLFWAFFEQAGSSVNNFTDRNVDRVFEERVITEAEIGTTLELTLSQEQLGYHNGDELITLNVLDKLRADRQLEVRWLVDAEDVGMGVGGSVIPASTFQSANPIFILLLGLPLSALWLFLGSRGAEPSTPVKFSLGLLQLGMGFAVLWYGATTHDPRGMVSISFLLLGYLLHTTGELCLSPVGLSMITKLSPARLVSTMMGAWFLATSFSSYLSAIIAMFTGVEDHGGGDPGYVPPPIETVMLYGSVFGQIAIAAIAASIVLLALSPLLKRGMHEAA